MADGHGRHRGGTKPRDEWYVPPPRSALQKLLESAPFIFSYAVFGGALWGGWRMLFG